MSTFSLTRFSSPSNPTAHVLVKILRRFSNVSGFAQFFAVGGVVVDNIYDGDEDVVPTLAVADLFARYGWKVVSDDGVTIVSFDHTVVPRTTAPLTEDLVPAKRQLKALTTDVLAWVRKDFFKQASVSSGNAGILYEPPGLNMVFGRAFVLNIYPAAKVSNVYDDCLTVHLV
jgi:hypothetical protein